MEEFQPLKKRKVSDNENEHLGEVSRGRVRFGLYMSNLATATQLLISELSYHTVQEAYIHKAETIDTAKTIAQRQKYNRCSDKIQEQEQDTFNNYAQM